MFANFKKNTCTLLMATSICASLQASPLLLTEQIDCKKVILKNHCDNHNVTGVLYGDWPFVGLNYTNNAVNKKEKKISIKNVSKLTKKWQEFNSGLGHAVQSQLIAADGIIYGADSGGHVFARNADTGVLLWETALGDQTPQNQQVFSTSPTLTKDVLYISYSSAFALNRQTGELIWQTPLYDPANFSYEYSGNNVIVDDLMIMGIASAEFQDTFHGSIIALDRSTGQKVWQFATTNSSFGAGNGVWSTPGIDQERGILYIGSGQTYSGTPSPYCDSLLALNYKTGALVWSYSYNPNDVWKDGDTLPPGTYDHDVSGHPALFSLNIDGNCVDYVGVSSKDGSFRIFTRDQANPSNVQPAVNLQLDAGGYVQGVSVGALINDGILYLSSSAFINETGQRVSIDYFDGSMSNLLNKTSMRILALDLETLVTVGNSGGVIPASAIIWEKFIGPGITVSNPLTLVNGVIFQTSWIGTIRAINAKTGDLLWQDTMIPQGPVGLPVFCSTGATVVNGKVYVGLGLEQPDTPLPGGGMAAYGL